MFKRPRVLIDALAAAFLILALACVSLFDRWDRKPIEPIVAPRPAAQVIRPPTVRLAVIRGTFDDMGRLLEGLGPGYRFEEIGEEALRDQSAATRFDAVFLTCNDNAPAPSGPPLGPALRAYVTDGGTLYASDLRFDDLKAAFPEFIDENSVTQATKQEQLKATVADPGLREVLGPELPLHFDLDGWRPAAFGGAGVTVYLKGSVHTMAGVTIEAPLMVKFPCGKGWVLFTSFHNTKQKSVDETKLLRFLVLSTVTAGAESGMVESMEKGGFTPVSTSLIEADPGKPSRTRTFEHKAPGKLVFSLGFDPRGARLRLSVNGPDGYTRTKEGTSTFTLDVPDAAKGQWTYTATAESVPYENFPFTLGVGTELPRADRPVASTAPVVVSPRRPGPTGDTVKFSVISTGMGAVADGPTRIAVTRPHYDDMGKLLASLGSGYRFDELSMDDLRRLKALDPYAILFLTCDVWPGDWAEGTVQTATNRDGVVKGRVNLEYVRQAADTIRRFVMRGGTLYASDLRYDCVVESFPERRFIDVDRRVYDDLQVAEREWIALQAPLAKVGTVEETLQRASLSPRLVLNLRALVMAIEGAGLADGVLLDSRDREAELRRQLGGLIPATDSDITAVANALAARARTIRAAQLSRKSALQAKRQRRVLELKEHIDRLRGSLSLLLGGSGMKQKLRARVVDPGLAEQVGQTIDLEFNTEDWTPANLLGPDQTVLLRGEYVATGGGSMEAPLLVRFKEGRGNVIFTSFHNEKQNSKQEEALLRYLVFTTVTAKAEEAVATTMLSGGFSTAGRTLQSHSSGQPSVTRTYRSTSAGRLRFALTFAGQDAAMRFSLTSPNGQIFEKETNQTLIVEATGAPAGEWRYTVTALRVPYENFPYSVSVSAGASGP